jgi:hypothetical protein
MLDKFFDLPKRRSFLKGATSAALSGLATAPFSIASGLPAVGTLLWIKASIFDSDKEKIEEKLRTEKYMVYLRSKQPNFLNVGVAHVDDLLNAQLEKTFLGQAIREANIVLLENTGGGGYFGKLKDYAEGLGKRVVDVDRAGGGLSQALRVNASLWASFRAIKQLGKDFVGLGLSENEKNKIRREWISYVLKTLGIAELGQFSPTLIGSMLTTRLNDIENSKGEYDAKYDISLMGDGRTIFMVLDIMKVMKENPETKIVVITGDAHATGINYYLYESEGQRKFKAIIYNIVYGWTKHLPF